MSEPPGGRLSTELWGSKGSKLDIPCGHNTQNHKLCSKNTFKIQESCQDEFCQSFPAYQSQPRHTTEVLFGLVFCLFFFSFPQPEELVFRWVQRSEPKDRIFQTGGWASSSEKSEDSWALPIWQIPSQTGSVGAWGLVTKRKVPRGIYKGQLALWKHLRGARVSTMLKANTCIALDSEQKTETRRELWNPHSGHLTAIKKKCVRHDGVCAFLYRNMVLL